MEDFFKNFTEKNGKRCIVPYLWKDVNLNWFSQSDNSVKFYIIQDYGSTRILVLGFVFCLAGCFPEQV